jgi:CubicO group peptidase (beta-lactamase class C family)
LANIVVAIAEAPLLFRPGSQLLYSNPGYFVLGRVIEVAAGEPYAAYVRRRILEPLGMRETFYAPPTELAGRMAALIQERKGERKMLFRLNPAFKIVNAAPDGGLFSTTRDMAKFLRLFLVNDGSILSRQTVETMVTPHDPDLAPDWGIGFRLEDGLFRCGGSSGTLGWGDPETRGVGLLFVQYQDDHQSREPVREAFKETARQALRGR